MAHPDLDNPAYRNHVMKNTIAMDIGRNLMLGFFSVTVRYLPKLKYRHITACKTGSKWSAHKPLNT